MRDIQKQVGEWSRQNFGDQISKQTLAELGSIAPLLGIVEEVGELTHAVLKRHQGIRGFDDDKVYEEARDDAIGDILIYLCDFCSREGVDVQHALESTWNGIVAKRDWKKDKDGGTGSE